MDRLQITLDRERSMRCMRRTLLTICALAIVAMPAAAETQSQKQVVAAGGGGSATTGYRLISTIGQPCVGWMSSGAIMHFIGFLSPGVQIASSAEEIIDLPQRAYLSQNFPNPFNPLTTIRFDLPDSRHVRLEVFSMEGRRVATLVDQDLPAGYLTVMWDGTDARGHPVASGTYMYRLTAGDFTASNRMVLAR